MNIHVFVLFLILDGILAWYPNIYSRVHHLSSSRRMLFMQNERNAPVNMNMKTINKQSKGDEETQKFISETINLFSNVSLAFANQSTKPISFDLKTKFSKTIQFNESTYARRYLSLPVSSYSLLDTSYIHRRPDKDDVFTLRLLFNNASDGKMLDFPREIILDIEVISDPMNGKIKMSSKDIYFIYHLLNSTSSTGMIISDSFDKKSTIPSYLLRHDAITYDGSEDMASALPLANDGDIMKKSPVQTKFNMVISWSPDPSLSPPLSINRFSFRSIPGIKHFFDNPSSFPVRTAGSVDIKINLPINSKVADIINMIPVKLAIKQITTFLVDRVIDATSKALIPLLLENYNKRKQVWIIEVTKDADSINTYNVEEVSI